MKRKHQEFSRIVARQLSSRPSGRRGRQSCRNRRSPPIAGVHANRAAEKHHFRGPSDRRGVAGTEWLLFTDADVVFSPTYFRALSQYAEFDCIYGPKLSQKQFHQCCRWFACGQRLSPVMGIPAASGSNLLVRRQVVTDVGGFDLELTCNEDSELVWRIKRAGWRIAFAADLPVYATDHRRLERGVFCKALHSVIRCLFLCHDLILARWRKLDWGCRPHAPQGEKAHRIKTE
jgi:hypothetical protein